MVTGRIGREVANPKADVGAVGSRPGEFSTASTFAARNQIRRGDGEGEESAFVRADDVVAASVR